MRIRRRPPLPLSPPEDPTNLSLQIHPSPIHEDQEGKLHSSDGDPSVGIKHGWILGTDPTPSDPQFLNEEKDPPPPPPPPPPPSTLDAQVHNNERTGVEMARSTNAKGKAKPNAIFLSYMSTCTSTTDGDIDDRVTNYNIGKKTRRPPAVLMEGSRCSRVNGRGWRCSQQTLIGYSLCEHHLGKGRIRSISSGGGGSGGVRVGSQELESSNASRKPKKKERERFGVVKARSMSSLLDEAGHNPVDAMAPPTAETNVALVGDNIV